MIVFILPDISISKLRSLADTLDEFLVYILVSSCRKFTGVNLIFSDGKFNAMLKFSVVRRIKLVFIIALFRIGVTVMLLAAPSLKRVCICFSEYSRFLIEFSYNILGLICGVFFVFWFSNGFWSK